MSRDGSRSSLASGAGAGAGVIAAGAAAGPTTALIGSASSGSVGAGSGGSHGTWPNLALFPEFRLIDRAWCVAADEDSELRPENVEPVTSDMHSRARVIIRKLRRVRLLCSCPGSMC